MIWTSYKDIKVGHVGVKYADSQWKCLHLLFFLTFNLMCKPGALFTALSWASCLRHQLSACILVLEERISEQKAPSDEPCKLSCCTVSRFMLSKAPVSMTDITPTTGVHPGVLRIANDLNVIGFVGLFVHRWPCMRWWSWGWLKLILKWKTADEYVCQNPWFWSVTKFKRMKLKRKFSPFPGKENILFNVQVVWSYLQIISRDISC